MLFALAGPFSPLIDVSHIYLASWAELSNYRIALRPSGPSVLNEHISSSGWRPRGYTVPPAKLREICIHMYPRIVLQEKLANRNFRLPNPHLVAKYIYIEAAPKCRGAIQKSITSGIGSKRTFTGIQINSQIL